MKLAITGANGYIGTQLVARAKLQGHAVAQLARRSSAPPIDEWMHFDLSQQASIVLPADINVVVHLATNPALSSAAECEAEIASVERLLDAAERCAAKFIFVSSQTAREDAPTLYGKCKWTIERKVLQRGGFIVRPGQVYGGAEQGLFGVLVALVRRLPILPAFVPAPVVQPVHVDDLAIALLRVAQRSESEPKIFSIAAVEPVTFTRFLSAIAAERLRRHRFFLPLPSHLIHFMIAVLGVERSQRIGIYRLKSLFDLPEMTTAADLQLLALELRPLKEGMRRATMLKESTLTRRQLLLEARVLLSYVLKQAPGSTVQRRYVRVIEQLRQARPIVLPDLVSFCPAMMALFDDRAFLASSAGSDLSWRLDAAISLAEATTTGAMRFLGTGRPAGVLFYGVQLAHAVLMEICWRLLRTLSMPLFLRRVIQRSFK